MKASRWVLLLAILAAGVVVARQYTTTWWSSQGTLVRGPSFEGIIMDTPRFQDITRPETWTVGRTTIYTMESDLDGYVARMTNRFRRIAPDLPLYYRQYYPWQTRDVRMITTEFYHPSLISRYEWLHRTPGGVGASGTYWRVDYDVRAHAFDNFRMRAGD
jgi:hypothetical protein